MITASLNPFRTSKLVKLCKVFCLFSIGFPLSVCCGQATITSVQPASCQIGATTALTINGTNLQAGLRLAPTLPGISIEQLSSDANQVKLSITLPQDTPLGPFGIWTAATDGPRAPIALIADDLPVTIETADNHSFATAQRIPSLCAVDGQFDSGTSDYFLINANAGERIAFEIQTQQLGSKADPLLRIWDSNHKMLHSCDDSLVGPEARFEHTFIDAGDYFIEVVDSAFAGGNTYHLRVGDFPILTSVIPLAVRPGESLDVVFSLSVPEASLTSHIEVPADFEANQIFVAAKIPLGKSSAWKQVQVCKFEQRIEGRSTERLDASSAPFGISGRLDSAKQADSFSIKGSQGKTLRFSSHTRSLESPTLLQMELFSPDNQRVAGTTTNTSDEWSFDYTFPDDRDFRLVVSDLAQRGGPEFVYLIELKPSGTFSVALKADAATKKSFSVDAGQGGFATDLQIDRFGYDGEIVLSLHKQAGLELLTPIIPSGVKDFHATLLADASWSKDSFAAIRLFAHAKDDPNNVAMVTSSGLGRVQEPSQLFFLPWKEGNYIVAGTIPSEDFYTIEPASPLQFARPLSSQTAVLNLRRLKEDFKDSVTLDTRLLPPGWTMTIVAEQDKQTCTLNRTNPEAVDLEKLPLLAITNYQGKLCWRKFELPIEWFDPVHVSVKPFKEVVAGKTVKIPIVIDRKGQGPSGVRLEVANLPPGLISPVERLVVASDQSTASIELLATGDISSALQQTIGIKATSNFSDSEFVLNIRSDPFSIVGSPKEVEVYPATVELVGSPSQQQLVVTCLSDSGDYRDWTRDANYESSDPSVAMVRDGVVIANGNGEAELFVKCGSKVQRVPVHIHDYEKARPIGFESDVLVALSKQGCNSGACHGSPSGKGNFRLSLRAFDPKVDELTIIRENFGRRINTLEPERSLLLVKPMMKVAHGGGKQLREDDLAYSVISNWIVSGAKSDPPETPRCEKLSVYPNTKRVLQLASNGQQISAIAHFTDGTHRDVTSMVAYESSNTDIATVDKFGRVRSIGRGEAVILVRYLEHIESVALMFVDNVEGFEWNALPSNNYIDELVDAKLHQLQYFPAPLCNDEEFVRRVYLDVLGILPTVDETKSFLGDKHEDKRERLINLLLEREEYPQFWATKWGDLLKMTSKSVGIDGVYKYHRWIEDAIRDNVPYDEFVRQLLTGTGSTLSNPTANFYRTANDMNECVETVSQVFLGARIQCAKCHNHPFERWTQDNYYGLGAFFNRVQRRTTERPGELFVWTAINGEVTQPRTGKILKPWLPKEGSVDVDPAFDRRERFVEWLTNPENPFFAKIEVNRIWSQLFARGIVDPIDDFRDSNPPSNESLLDALAKDFVTNGFDRKHILRTILKSRTYQAKSSVTSFNETDQLYFSHQIPRILSAEQLLDALTKVTGTSQSFGSLPKGTRATQMPAPDIAKVAFLKTFGQPERSTVCACERADDSNLGMAIELFNGSQMHSMMKDPNNRFRKRIAEGISTQDILSELYLAALCRLPTDLETQISVKYIENASDVTSGVEDICWALLNSDEFLFQH